jgi:hypothetical protein
VHHTNATFRGCFDLILLIGILHRGHPRTHHPSPITTHHQPITINHHLTRPDHSSLVHEPSTINHRHHKSKANTTIDPFNDVSRIQRDNTTGRFRHRHDPLRAMRHSSMPLVMHKSYAPPASEFPKDPALFTDFTDPPI